MSESTFSPERPLTIDERFTWGICPVCKAEHGYPCHPEFGLHIGRKSDGGPMNIGDGAHLARLDRAPMKIRMVPV